MKILITGGSGMLGRHLIPVLRAAGHTVVVVSRAPRHDGEISWDAPFPEVDAAIHLAGERVVAQRWTPKFIKKLYASRVETAEKLKSKLTPACKVIITASGVNCYAHGNYVSVAPTESAPVDTTHELGRLCAAWEGAWQKVPWPARVVALRIGFVISPDDSGIQTMLPIYRCGLGGVIGNGRQRMCWIAIDDLVRIFVEALENEKWQGPVNAIAPQPITFQQFNAAFARAVHRPAFWRIPAFAARLIFGPLADEMILPDAPALPQKLLDAGFSWRTTDISAALKKAIRR